MLEYFSMQGELNFVKLYGLVLGESKHQELS